jgi:hypothetical protein
MIKPGVYKHYKGKLYLVLGTGMPIAETIPIQLTLGLARHSETGVVYKVGMLSGIWVAKFDPTLFDPMNLPPIEPLVIYVPLYDTGGPPYAVRPATMWDEQVPVDPGSGAEPYAATRFTFVRDA